jgi:ubiquinone biosynthesis protein UbiJ
MLCEALVAAASASAAPAAQPMAACIPAAQTPGRGTSQVAAYNASAMLDALAQVLAPPVLERLTLVLNHVLRAEPAAIERLTPHAGRELAVLLRDWPALLPPPPPLRWRVTPAGLLEWCGLPAAAGSSGGAPSSAAEQGPAAGNPGQAADELRVIVDARNPAALLARAMAGERPGVQVEGDAAFAADIGWLLANLRWDVAADLERFFGPVVAGQLHQLGRALARGLRSALDAAAGLAAKTRAAPMASTLAEKVTQVTSRFGPGRR